MVALGCSGIRAVSRFTSAILADFAIRGFAISFLTLAGFFLTFPVVRIDAVGSVEADCIGQSSALRQVIARHRTANSGAVLPRYRYESMDSQGQKHYILLTPKTE
jgi:hypothetical protein